MKSKKCPECKRTMHEFETKGIRYYGHSYSFDWMMNNFDKKICTYSERILTDEQIAMSTYSNGSA